MLLSTKVSHSFTVADALVNTPQSARDSILNSIDGDKALRMARLAYEVLEGLQFGLGGVKIVVDQWLTHQKGQRFDYRRGDGIIIRLTDPDYLWDAWEALAGSVGRRFMFLDADGNATKIHVSLPEAGWVWWEGKRSWEIRTGQFLERDCVVNAKGELVPFDGLRPRHLRPQPVAPNAEAPVEAPVEAPPAESPAPKPKATVTPIKAAKPKKAKKAAK